MIQEAGSTLIAVMFAKFMLNDIPHTVGLYRNPGNPISSEVSEILRRTGMAEYEERHFPPSEGEGKPRRGPAYTRTKNIGPYSVVMTRTDGTGTVKLYENLEGWKRKLRGTWTGFSKAECSMKFEQVYETTKQVRAKNIYEMRKALGE